LGAVGFHRRAQQGDPRRSSANVLERFSAEVPHLRMNRIEHIGDERVQNTPQCFIYRKLVCCGGVQTDHRLVETPKQRNTFADLIKRKDAGVEPVIEIGGEVCDLIGEVNHLGFQRRKPVEEVFGKFGMLAWRVVAGVLHDSLAHGEGEVEAAHGCVAFFKPGDDAQCVQVVVKSQPVCAEALIESFLPSVAKRRVADVVHQG